MTNIFVYIENQFYCCQDGILFNKNKTTLIYYPNKRDGAYIIPDGVKTIEELAFYGCKGLTDIIFTDIKNLNIQRKVSLYKLWQTSS